MPTTPGRLIWITGLSGAGKTTVARLLQKQLSHSVLLDGDELRAALGAENRHTQDDRRELAFTYARLSQLIASQGTDILCATISMFHDVHAFNRTYARYVEIFLDVPEAERERRDPKKIYARSHNVVGRDVPSELPTHPHLKIPCYGEHTPEKIAAEILDWLEKNKP